MSILPIAPLPPIAGLNPITPISFDSDPNLRPEGVQKNEGDFSKFLSDAIGQVDALQTKADVASLELATGQVQDVSEVMVALEKASLSLSLTVATRDKMIDAYNQVIRMQL